MFSDKLVRSEYFSKTTLFDLNISQQRFFDLTISKDNVCWSYLFQGHHFSILICSQSEQSFDLNDFQPEDCLILIFSNNHILITFWTTVLVTTQNAKAEYQGLNWDSMGIPYCTNRNETQQIHDNKNTIRYANPNNLKWTHNQQD